MKKKLIEVALPLEAINMESAREKSIRHGHPSTLHLWWARRPLAACRAVLWASLVDDPSSWPDKFPKEEDQTRERQRLFDILGRITIETDKKGNTKQVVRGLVSWDEINDPKSGVLEAAQREIARCLAWDRGEEPPTEPDAVREYIAKYAPPAYDPFAGGGSIPLEAQRLGLEAHASDLNPVAVLINKALIEIPPMFKDQPPVNPEVRSEYGGVRSEKNITQFSFLSSHSYSGAQGLAADVRYYGQWMRDRAFERIGHLYPQVEVSEEKREVSESKSSLLTPSSSLLTPSSSLLTPRSSLLTPRSSLLTVIAWLWARTVKCPNPACGCQMPLVRSFQLSTKKGKEAWVEPVVEVRKENRGMRKEDLGARSEPSPLTSHSSPLTSRSSPLTPSSSLLTPQIRFVVKSGEGKAPDPPKTGRGATFSCLACGQPAGDKHIKAEGVAGRMDAQLMAIVAEGKNGRIYLSPTPEQEEIARSAKPTWYPDGQIGDDRRSMFTPLYGLTHFHHLFTPRQLVALTTFSDLVSEARERATQDAIAAGLPDDDVPLSEGGTGARAYGEAIANYLGLAVGKATDTNSSLASWQSRMDRLSHVFTRQALPMVWDFAEPNAFGGASGDIWGAVKSLCEVLDKLERGLLGFAFQKDAASQKSDFQTPKIISTDPPYYDNVGYGDLSDYFYVWLRSSLKSIYPALFSTLLVPKAQELVATPYRFDGSKQKAQAFFEEGLGKAFNRMHEISHADYPLTVYYAFKQAETDQKGKSDESVASTGWETMLEGLIKADFSINGTWPMRSELSNRMVASGTNALASSIVLVCRPRPTDAPKASRRQFLTELKRQLPPALKTLQQGNIAPVDLAQASIGPGMAVYSQYAAVLENDGSPLRVRTALQLINQILDEFLTEQEGEFDGDTRWALTWFEQHQFEPGQYGDAETLSKAKNTSVQGMVDAGILEAKGGKVRLLRREEIGVRNEERGERNEKRGKKGKDLTYNSLLSSPSSLLSSPSSLLSSPHWLITQSLIHQLERHGETGAAELLAKLGDRHNIARDLAYRLYSLCDKKGWTQEALAYNSLVTSWFEISRLAAAIRQASQTSLF